MADSIMMRTFCELACRTFSFAEDGVCEERRNTQHSHPFRMATKHACMRFPSSHRAAAALRWRCGPATRAICYEDVRYICRLRSAAPRSVLSCVAVAGGTSFCIVVCGSGRLQGGTTVTQRFERPTPLLTLHNSSGFHAHISVVARAALLLGFTAHEAALVAIWL